MPVLSYRGITVADIRTIHITLYCSSSRRPFFNDVRETSPAVTWSLLKFSTDDDVQECSSFARVNVGNSHFFKPLICWNFTLLLVQFSILSCDNAVLVVWLGLHLCLPIFMIWLEMSRLLVRNGCFYLPTTAGNCPKVLINISRGVTLTSQGYHDNPRYLW